MNNPFDSELFDHIAYAYRTAPGHKPELVVAAFQALQAFCKGVLVTADMLSKTDADRGSHG
jgi:hypothetical protein